MEFTPTNIDAIFSGFNLRWQGAYLEAPTYYSQFADPMPSSARDEKYFWLDRVPAMTEWLASRSIANASVRSYVLANRDWELTLELDRNAVQDDQYGVFGGVVQMMGLSARLLPDQLMIDQLQNGHTTGALYICHDGQPFYSASHPIQIDNAGSATQSNYFTSTALNATNFNSVRQTMVAYQGNDLKPLGIMPNLLHIPPQLNAVARQILNTSFIAPATALGMNSSGVVQSNPLIGMADILEHPYLNNQSTTWYFHQTKGGVVKPYVYQQRQAPIFVYKNRPDDEQVFLRKKFLFGQDARAAAGITLYFYSAKAVA